MRGEFYCMICWQEFDSPAGHNAASAFAGKRLNGFCVGDIRRREKIDSVKRGKPDGSQELEFTGEPIEIK